jgi:hypothetical protein
MSLLGMLLGEEPGIIDTLLHYENKGQFGEYATEYALTHDNIKGYGKALHNIYLPNKGKTTELDVLFLHEKGIFVLESKNYSGWIFGSAEQQKWTQCLRGGEKSQFYNPIKQNEIHRRALAEFLHLSPDAISSYIIFSNCCELKQVPADTDSCKIVRRENLLRLLRRDLESRTASYSPVQVNAMAALLQPLTNVSVEQKAQHIDAIKERTEGTICPFCGGNIKLRSGKYGSFYGCSNYPKCRYTRPIKNG